MTPETTTVEGTRHTLDRRAALKAALGGAAAAGVLAGPGISSFGTAPAYAVSCSAGSQQVDGINVGTTGATNGTNQVFCYGQFDGGSACDPRLNYLNFVAAGVFFEIESNGQAFNSTVPAVAAPTGQMRVRRLSGTAECDVSFNSIFCPTGSPTGSFATVAVPTDGSFTAVLGGDLGCQVASPCTGTSCGSWISIDFVCCT